MGMSLDEAFWLLDLHRWGWLELLDRLQVDVVCVGLNPTGWFNCGLYPEFVPYVITKKWTGASGENAEYKYYTGAGDGYTLIKDYYFGYPEEVFKYLNNAHEMVIQRARMNEAKKHLSSHDNRKDS